MKSTSLLGTLVVLLTASAMLGSEPTPQTTTPSARTPRPAASEDFLSTSHDGLAERMAPVQAGGYAIHLQGRLQTAVVGRVGANGRVQISCVEPGATRPSNAAKRELRHAQ